MIKLNNWIHKELRENGHLRAMRTVLILHFIFIMISVISGPHYLSRGFTNGGILMLCIIPICVLHIVMIRFFSSLTIHLVYFFSLLYSVTTALVVFSGGVGSPYVISLFAIGPPVFLIFPDKLAWRWQMLVILTFLVIAAYQIMGYTIPYSIPSDLVGEVWLVVFFGNSILLNLAVASFQSRSKNYYKKIKGSNVQLASANEELERFAYIASHDLKSPLMTIINFGGLMDKKYSKNFDAKGQEFLNIIRSSADQMETLVEDILEFSQTKSHEAKMEHVDICEMVGTISQDLNNGGIYDTAQITHNCDVNFINTDRTLIRQLLQNLIENGLKYNDSDIKKVSVHISADHQDVKIEITDNGIGMKPEYFGRIFEMFQRLHNSREYQGTGIGLAICKKIVNTLGGEITVDSKLGQGSTFSVTLPQDI